MDGMFWFGVAIYLSTFIMINPVDLDLTFVESTGTWRVVISSRQFGFKGALDRALPDPDVWSFLLAWWRRCHDWLRSRTLPIARILIQLITIEVPLERDRECDTVELFWSPGMLQQIPRWATEQVVMFRSAKYHNQLNSLRLRIKSRGWGISLPLLNAGASPLPKA